MHDQVRIAAYCHLYAFDHGVDLDQPVYQQPVRSRGIEIGRDVWLGAHVGVKDGIHIDDHAVIGMNSMVTKNVEKRPSLAAIQRHLSATVNSNVSLRESYGA